MPISTALEGSFNVLQCIGKDNDPKCLRAPSKWRKDFADVTAVNGLTADFRFFTSPRALCDNGVKCQTDQDCDVGSNSIVSRWPYWLRSSC
jgi:hypothetical protein